MKNYHQCICTYKWRRIYAARELRGLPRSSSTTNFTEVQDKRASRNVGPRCWVGSPAADEINHILSVLVAAGENRQVPAEAGNPSHRRRPGCHRRRHSMSRALWYVRPEPIFWRLATSKEAIMSKLVWASALLCLVTMPAMAQQSCEAKCLHRCSESATGGGTAQSDCMSKCMSKEGKCRD